MKMPSKICQTDGRDSKCGFGCGTVKLWKYGNCVTCRGTKARFAQLENLSDVTISLWNGHILNCQVMVLFGNLFTFSLDAILVDDENIWS